MKGVYNQNYLPSIHRGIVPTCIHVTVLFGDYIQTDNDNDTWSNEVFDPTSKVYP